jgi:hypothetical protein
MKSLTLNVFDVQRSIECWGLWYALWRYGFRQSWTIFVAWRLAARDTAIRNWN